MTATSVGAGGPVAPAGSGFRLSDKAQERLAGFLFVAPALAIVIVFIFVPIVFTVYISTTDWTGLQPPQEAQSVGLSNYGSILTEPGNARVEFLRAVKNTFYYTLIVVPTQTIISLLLAIVVNQRFLKGRGFFRTAFYFPSITSSIVVGTIFLFIFARDGILNYLIKGLFPNYGVVKWLEDPTGLFHNIFNITRIAQAPEWLRTDVLGIRLYDWLSGPSTTMLAIMLLAIWTTSGTMMLIFLAALQDIPTPLYEAAQVDGASKIQQFFKITVPMLRPTTFFVVTLGLIGCFQVFDQIFVISQGAPASTTTTIAWITYRSAFRDNRAGLGAATAIVLFGLIVIFTLIQRRLVGSKVQA
jgi:multiple sugar transport system permease protein